MLNSVLMTRGREARTAGSRRLEPAIAPPNKEENKKTISTGMIVTPISCSGTCLIFSIPRQPKASTVGSAARAGRRGAGGERLEDRFVCGRMGLNVRRCAAHAARLSIAVASSVGSSCSAGWPASERNTSSSVG